MSRPVNEIPDGNQGCIYPLHNLDTYSMIREMLLVWTFRFDDVLDTNKVQNALVKLLTLGDWRKLSGRLRLREDGTLELLVPSQFTTQCPAVTFTHDELHDMSIKDHHLGSQLPRPTADASIQVGADKFRALAGKGAPRSIQDLINVDRPAMTLHFISFRDATIMNLTWPHVLIDGVAQKNLLQAWSLVLADQTERVPRVFGAMEDVLWQTAESIAAEVKPNIEKQRMSTFGLAKLAVRYAWKYLCGSGAERRTIFLHPKALAAIQARASNDEGPGTKARENEAIVAWLSSVLASGKPNPQPVTIINIVNARFRLPELMCATGVYLQNMVLFSFTFLSPQVACGPLQQIAATQRQCTEEQTTETELIRLLRLMRKEQEAGGELKLHYGDPTARVIFVNNLTKIDILKAVNFGPAVVGSKGGLAASPPGTPTYYHFTQMEDKDIANFFVIFGKDHSGGQWISGSLSPSNWARFEEEIRGL